MSARTREERLLAVYLEAFEAQRSPFTDAGFTGSRDRVQHACVAAIIAALEEERQTDDAPAERPAAMVNDSQWMDVHRHVSRCAVALGIVPGQYQTKGDTIRLVARVADAMASEPSAPPDAFSPVVRKLLDVSDTVILLGGAKLEGFASGVGVDVEPPEAGTTTADRRLKKVAAGRAHWRQRFDDIEGKLAEERLVSLELRAEVETLKASGNHPAPLTLPSGWVWEQTETPFHYVGAFRETCTSDKVRVAKGTVHVTGVVPPSVVVAALRQFEAEDAEG